MCSQRETKLPLPRFLCLLERWDLRMFSTDSAASFQIHFIFHRLLEREVKWRVWGHQRRLLSWYLLTSKCPQLCGRDGAGLGTICDNCDDNDILVCNVCVHTVSRVKTLNTRWWGSGGHWGSAPRCPHHHQLHCHSSHSFDQRQLNQQSLLLAVDIN